MFAKVLITPSNRSSGLFYNLEMNFEKALDENFDGFIAKGNNNFIEIILDGQGTFFVCLKTVRSIIRGGAHYKSIRKRFITCIDMHENSIIKHPNSSKR